MHNEVGRHQEERDVVDLRAALFVRLRHDKLDLEALKPFGRVLLPLSLAKSANYAWLYGTICISPTIDKAAAKIDLRLLHRRQR